MDLVSLPGGTFRMGLGDDELAELQRRRLDPAALSATPAREVKVAAFRCLRAPLSPEVVAPLADYTTLLDAALVTAADAVKVAKALRMRLLSEAEWEYVARMGGTTWLLDRRGRRPATHALGIEGLALGSWVGDGWHASYRRAPKDSRPWAPKRLPEVVRAGGVKTMPWQVPGEEIAVHVAYRTRDPKGRWPLLLAATDQAPRLPAPAKEELRFVELPGGSFEMGLSDARRRALAALLPDQPKVRAAFDEVAATCAPARKVTVRPFRCALAPLTVDAAKRLGKDASFMGPNAMLPPEVAVGLAKRFGARLLTEAEWEFVARDGGALPWGEGLERLLRRSRVPITNRWGIAGVSVPAFVADAWRPTYAGAPTAAKVPEVIRADADPTDRYAREDLAQVIRRLRLHKRDPRWGSSWALLFARDLA
jgi:formylglycine-generating enzyme required for sulfatase activity